jgi:hypothetical protein
MPSRPCVAEESLEIALDLANKAKNLGQQAIQQVAVLVADAEKVLTDAVVEFEKAAKPAIAAGGVRTDQSLFCTVTRLDEVVASNNELNCKAVVCRL